MDITLTHMEQLKQLSTRFGEPFTRQKEQLLTTLAAMNAVDVKVITAYHEVLLFLKAYPENRTLLDLTLPELKKLAVAVSNLSESKKEKLVRSGITLSETRANFSFTLCKWLVKTYPGKIKLYSLEGDTEWGKELLKLALPKADSEGMPAASIEDWLTEHIQEEKRVEILLQLIDNLEASSRLKEHIWEALRVFITVTLTSGFPSRTFNSLPVSSVCFHKKELLKRVDAVKEIRTPLPRPKKLNASEKELILRSARASLFLLNRETDTITYTNENEMLFFELERGIQVALFGLIPERRLPFETYIGYMTFKNGVPVAYGGAWPFQRIARIGLNIYEPFRGGESAYLFTQLMRVYHQVYKVNQFTVEPYQIGYGNKEGLQSGAFWFYYRLGFRSTDKKTALRAEEENQKINTMPGYRSSVDVLKKLTASHMLLEVIPLKSSEAQSPFMAEELTALVSEYIDAHFEGNRVHALNHSVKKMRQWLAVSAAAYERWSAVERFWFGELSLLFTQMPLLKKEKTEIKKQLIQLIKAKVAKQERDFLFLWQKFPLLHQYLNRLLHQ
ncbi:MAG: hypothetical protein IT247_07840 [Bacteroidia bacterium]|nr:hypothetical protein [Bacteroidia bacterium]